MTLREKIRKRDREGERVYSFIINYIKENLYPPTIDEIDQTIKPEYSTVNAYLTDFVNKGLITFTQNRPLEIKVLGYSVIANEVLVRLYEDYARKEEEELP